MTQTETEITVEVDLYVTRRKRVHEVSSASLGTVFHAQSVGDLLRWLHENDHWNFEVIDGTSRFRIALSVPRPDITPEE